MAANKIAIARKLAHLHFELTKVNEAIKQLGDFAKVIADGGRSIEFMIGVVAPEKPKPTSQYDSLFGGSGMLMLGISGAPAKPKKIYSPKIKEPIQEIETYEVLALLLRQKQAAKQRLIRQISDVLGGGG